MMSKRFQTYCLLLMLIAVAIGCANRGRPSGGERDITPPEITKSYPENLSTNFKGKEIRISFNEFIKIKDLQKQLIISPPMDTQPEIRPLGSASKEIRIKIKDTLPPNTTYAFNFGESIVDNNEENPFSYYRYVFSTGDTIDSLSVKGVVLDAENRRADSFISVMLYEADTSYNDSIVFKEKPKYITNTLDSLTTFSIDNIKAGKYKLIALKDENSNYTFQPKQDKIGFYDGVVTVPSDTTYTIKLFKEELNFKISRPLQIAEQRLAFPFEGNPEETEITILSDTLKQFDYRLTRDKVTDSLYYWYKPKLEIDSVFFEIKNGKYLDTLKHRFRVADKDSLTISVLKAGVLGFNDVFTLEGSTPFEKIDTTKITFINKDSLKVPYRIEFDKVYNRYKFPIQLEEDEAYKVQLLPEAITDFYGESNDTLDFNFKTLKKANYASIRVNLVNAKFPLIVQLVDDKGKVLYEKYTENHPIVDFNDIELKLYNVRVVFDTNGNKKFDTGNYLKKQKPERISYMKALEPLSANFEYNETFILD